MLRNLYQEGTVKNGRFSSYFEGPVEDDIGEKNVYKIKLAGCYVELYLPLLSARIDLPQILMSYTKHMPPLIPIPPTATTKKQRPPQFQVIELKKPNRIDHPVNVEGRIYAAQAFPRILSVWVV